MDFLPLDEKCQYSCDSKRKEAGRQVRKEGGKEKKVGEKRKGLEKRERKKREFPQNSLRLVLKIHKFP